MSLNMSDIGYFELTMFAHCTLESRPTAYHRNKGHSNLARFGVAANWGVSAPKYPFPVRTAAAPL